MTPTIDEILGVVNFLYGFSGDISQIVYEGTMVHNKTDLVQRIDSTMADGDVRLFLKLYRRFLEREWKNSYSIEEQLHIKRRLPSVVKLVRAIDLLYSYKRNMYSMIMEAKLCDPEIDLIFEYNKLCEAIKMFSKTRLQHWHLEIEKKLTL